MGPHLTHTILHLWPLASLELATSIRAHLLLIPTATISLEWSFQDTFHILFYDPSFGLEYIFFGLSPLVCPGPLNSNLSFTQRTYGDWNPFLPIKCPHSVSYCAGHCSPAHQLQFAHTLFIPALLHLPKRTVSVRSKREQGLLFSANCVCGSNFMNDCWVQTQTTPQEGSFFFFFVPIIAFCRNKR